MNRTASRGRRKWRSRATRSGNSVWVAVVALLLSVIGIYGVMGYYVQQHLQEISIRMALGSSQSDVARLVVGQGMTVVGMGIAVGVALALGATRLMSSLLFNVGASDPSAFAGASTLLFVIAVLVRGSGVSRDAAAAGRST